MTDKISLEIKSQSLLLLQVSKSNHTGLNYSPKLLRDKTSPHSSTSVDQVKDLLNQLLKLLKPQKSKPKRNNQRKRNNSPKKYKKNKKEEWVDSLIDSYLNSLWILFN